jgi:hypothetical protein
MWSQALLILFAEGQEQNFIWLFQSPLVAKNKRALAQRFIV